MTVLLGLAAGLLVGWLVWLLLRPAWNAPVLLRRNWRHLEVPTAAGIVVPLTVVAVEAGRLVAGASGPGPRSLVGPRASVALLVAGMALLGLLDDLLGGDDARGFRGHLGALAQGRLTTGAVKLFGGLAVAVVAVAAGRPGQPAARLVADAALVALAANLGNLFDRRPGRVAKAALVAFTVLVVGTAARAVLAPVAVAVGAAAALLVDDLRERLMLGDTGANAVGGVLGLGVVLACGPVTRTVVLLGVFGLNLLSEVVSFGRVIDAVPPLRTVDRWGRRA